ncbi:MAG: large protein, partial [Chitinophagaceae bacterium]|nr:large protein [Chitinophagaceae bacterium]
LNGVDVVDGGTISGATTSALAISSLVSGDAGNYTVNITGVCGSPVTSAVSALVVNVGASITTQPVATQTVCTGNPIAFSVSATGSSLTYQWKLAGVSLVDGGTVSGATAATLTISAVAAGDAGNYTVDVSAAGCGVPLTSTISTLVVNNSIVINNQPVANQNLCAGSSASFTAVVSGTGITYQWQKDGVNLTDGGTISGAMTATLTISSVVTGDAGDYTLDITGICGTATSNISTLAVTSSVAITMQPTDVSACLGQAANFDLTATGPSLTYQWKKNGVDMVDGGSISGSTTSSVVFSPVAAADADIYTCVISSSCGVPVTSNTVTMTVGAGVAITKQPISSVICLGQSASFTIQAPGAISFQWQFKPAGGSYADLSNGSGVSGVTTSTLIITGTQFSNRGNYRCVVTGGSCSGGVFSAAASLSFQSPSIASQPLSQSVCTGQTVTFGLVALGNNLTYQWVKGGVNMTNGGRVSGAQSATLKISNADLTDVATYYCEVRGLCPPPTFSDDVDLSLSTCTGIEEAIDGTLFNIYPNPSTGIYHLDMDMYAAGTLTYEVFNTLGESITSDEIHGEGKVVSVIDLSSQVAGMYIIKLNYDDKHSWVRLVLEK